MADRPDPAVLVDQLRELAIRLVATMDADLGRRGLSRARAEALLVLDVAGSVTQRQLSEQLCCSPRNVTGLIDGLAAAGLVDRARHPTDRRAVALALTASGAELAATLRTEQHRAGSEFFGGVDAAELHGFQRVLEGLLDRLDPGAPAGRIRERHAPGRTDPARTGP